MLTEVFQGIKENDNRGNSDLYKVQKMINTWIYKAFYYFLINK